MDDKPAGLAGQIDTSRPSIARVYDYWLGGKDNFAVDRALADAIAEQYPASRDMAIDNRRFLSRAVPWCVRQGCSQFLDLGAGLPTAENTHQSARTADPSARAVYVDLDPVAVLHAQALLAGSPGIGAALADLRDPGAVLAHQAVCEVIDFSRPAGIIMTMVLHFCPVRQAREIVAEYVKVLVPGSFLILSIGRNDDAELFEKVRGQYSAAGDLYNHSRDEVLSFFGDGLELVTPGLVLAHAWRGGMPDAGLKPDGAGYALAGVAVRR